MDPNVLMLGWELPPHNTGGLGVACQGLTRGLASKGVKISFALPKKLPGNVPYMEILDHGIDGVEVTAINSALEPYLSATKYQYDSEDWGVAHPWGNDLYAESYLFADKVVHWSRRRQFDLIHAHDWMTYPAAMAVRRYKGKPFVAHVHATEYDRTGGHVDSRIADIEYHGLNQADQVIAVSNYTKQVIHDHYSVNTDRITVVHNGIDPVPFTGYDVRRIFPNDHIVIYVGRLTFQKGVEYFLRSAKQVLASVPNTVFLVVGDGDMFQRHILEAAYLGISRRVIFTGHLRGEKLRSIYKMADLFVMPSVSEPYGLVALEAIAAGVPAIISKTSGVRETVHHVQEVDFWDVNKMASQIITSLMYPAFSRSTNHTARQDLKALSWDAAAEKTMSVYQTLLAPSA